MASLNKVIIIGHLGRDPEMRYTSSGQAVANFTRSYRQRGIAIAGMVMREAR